MTFAQTLLCFSVKSVWVFPYQYGLCLQDGQLSGELKICPVLPCCLTFFWLLGGICHNLKWKVSLLIDLFSQSLISPGLLFVPFCLLAIRSLILDWTPLFLPMSLVILDATELHPLQMIEQTFHQRCLKRVETHRLQTYHWGNSTARPKFSSRPILLKSSPIFFFSWPELGQPNAEICDGPNTWILTSVKIHSGSYPPIPQGREHPFSKHWHKTTLNIFELLLKRPPLYREVSSVSSICRATISFLKPQLKSWWATWKAIELDAWSKVIPLQPKVVFESLAHFWLYH